MIDRVSIYDVMAEMSQNRLYRDNATYRDAIDNLDRMLRGMADLDDEEYERFVLICLVMALAVRSA